MWKNYIILATIREQNIFMYEHINVNQGRKRILYTNIH